MSEFYLTLMSNSSLQFYPENQTNNFTVKLPQTVNLNGSFDVALCEISFNMTIENVCSDNNNLIIELEAVNYAGESLNYLIEEKISIPQGFYATVSEILHALNLSLMSLVPSLINDEIKIFHKDGLYRKVCIDSLTFKNVLNFLEKLKKMFVGGTKFAEN